MLGRGDGLNPWLPRSAGQDPNRRRRRRQEGSCWATCVLMLVLLVWWSGALCEDRRHVSDPDRDRRAMLLLRTSCALVYGLPAPAPTDQASEKCKGCARKHARANIINLEHVTFHAG